jgi:hypothetical protein
VCYVAELCVMMLNCDLELLYGEKIKFKSILLHLLEAVNQIEVLTQI